MNMVAAVLALAAALLTPAQAAAVPSAESTRFTAKASAARSAGSGCDNTDHSFDYLLLVEQDPLEFNEPDPEGVFTLHGLW